jgi:hypothetical protein
MKTVLVRGDAPVPPELRDLVARGSTALEERRAGELDGTALDADRIVFWSVKADDRLRALVSRLARAEAAERREILVFVTAEPDAHAAAVLSPNECFVWPRDEDRLKMAFLTGA